MYSHICQLPINPEDDNFMSSRGLVKTSFKDKWKRWCNISQKTPASNMYMDSITAMAAERRTHAGLKYWWIIHPFSYIRFLWMIVMTAIYLISLFLIPLMICFVVMDHRKILLDKVNIVIYTFCWLDIIFNCFTGYNDEKNMRVEMDLAKIWKNYLKSYLVTDILSSLPYDHITLPWRRLPGNNSYHVVNCLNLLPLLKLTRYRTLNFNLFQLLTHFEIKHYHYEMFTTLLLGIYMIFWFACLCYLLPVLVMHFMNTSDCTDCWITLLRSDSLTFRFQHAVFIVLETLSASGYGAFKPRTDAHIALGSILMLIGRLLECYIIVMFLQIKAGMKASESKFQEIMNQLSAYTRQKQLPAYMKIRLLAYYHYRFKNSYFREKSILLNLSEQLRQEIALQSCRRLVENVAIFKTLPKHILQSIVKNLKFELYLPNDVIVKAGSQGDCMFFLSTGSVAVLTPTGKEINKACAARLTWRDHERCPYAKIICVKNISFIPAYCTCQICHLDDGAHFGEVALLVPDQRRVASVVAIDVCEVYRLDRRDFRKCIAVHSELFAKIEHIATERIERAIIVEEQHKRYLMRGSQVQEHLQKNESRKVSIK